MATVIRLKRMGTKKRPYYRVVAIDSRKSVGGTTLEVLGHYSPIEVPAKVVVHEESVFKWLDEGAKASDTVNSLFSQIGLSKKYRAKKAGEDISAMEIATTITEKPRARHGKKKNAE